jgi:hypothetical protein
VEDRLEHTKTAKILIKTNEYQTQLTKELKDSIEPEVYGELVEFIQSVEFVANLISPDRPRVEDLEKDDRGRAIIDVTRPHILEDMEFFLQSRRHFEKHKYYTSAKFSRDPKSEYRRYWDREKDRSLNGMVNPETGEWISGYNYHYWNFARIDLTVERKGSVVSSTGTVRSDRDEFFPDVWEIDYFYFHYIEQGEEAGLYGALLKCRGMGASFKSADMAIRNFFLIKKSKSYMFSYHSNYLYEDGIMDKVMVGENFHQRHTAYKKRKLKTTKEHLQTGYKDKRNNNAYAGYLSEIIPVITKDPNSARGKRGKLVVHEEGGSNKHLLDSWGITDKSLDDKGNVFGYQLGQGTGGDDKSDFKGLSTLFFRPKGFKVYPLRNVFDKNQSNTMCGFFMGEYMNRPRSYNENGTTDVIKNLISIFTNRHTIEKEIEDPEIIAKKKAEGAITPLEAITTMGVSVFPKEAEKMQIADLSSRWEEIKQKHQFCRPIRSGEQVRLTHSGDYFPITEFPYVGKQANRAAVTIKTMPEKHGDGSIPSLRYIMGIDTLDDDNDSGTGSHFAWQIMDLWKDDIVAWYIGRNIMVEEDYEIALSMCILYNASANYESNLKGLYAHFKNKNALNYLCETPQILLDKSYIGNRVTIGNKSKGTRANQFVNAWGRRLQADWQRKEHIYYTDKTGVETVEDIEYLRECSMWDPMGNYDKVSCGNMLFIYREDLIKITESTKFDTVNESDYENDAFLGEMNTLPEMARNQIDDYNDDLNF